MASSETENFSETASDLEFIDDDVSSSEAECENFTARTPEDAESDESLEVLYELNALRGEKEKTVYTRNESKLYKTNSLFYSLRPALGSARQKGAPTTSHLPFRMRQ